MPPSDAAARRTDAFASTQWSLVAAAGAAGPAANAALAELCAGYWQPIYAYCRRRGLRQADAEDATQAFFAELLEKGAFAQADPHRGRFRTFLLAACRHFLANQEARRRTRKRGGGRVPWSLDFATAEASIASEPADRLTPEQWFDRQWALATLQETLDRLAAEHHAAGKEAQFQALKPLLVGDAAVEGYAEVASRLGVSAAAARQSVARMRRRYRELLRQAIGRTVAHPDEIEDELRRLFASLS